MQKSSSHTPYLILAVAMGLAFAAGLTVQQWVKPNAPGAEVPGLLWPAARPLPDFVLKDYEGRDFDRGAFLNKWSLVFFGFTHCPDICPTTLATLNSAFPELQSNGHFGETGQVVFISVDPERDGPEQLKQYVSYFNRAFHGVTGSEEMLTTLAQSIGALFVRVPIAKDEYTMDHSAGVFLIDPKGRLVGLLRPPHTPARIVEHFSAIADFVDAQG
ncbi:MAG: SCO family protein [Pseudomonadota bacterium]